MDPDTFRGGIRVGPDVYWRRRMALLIGMLIVVALVAWACSSASKPERAAAPLPPVYTPAGDPLPAGLHTTSFPPRPTARSTTRRPVPSPTPARPVRRPGDECRADDLVVSLSGRREVYPPGTRPTFLLTLVNTGRVMCRAEVGPRALEIRITSGTDRIWSSSDCVSGEDAETRRLRRGVPYVRSVSWDRRRSGENCAEAERADARPGTYVAVVRGERMTSPKAVFHLR